MLLTIDVGNSNSKLAFFSGEILSAKTSVATRDLLSSLPILKQHFPLAKYIAVSSVAPQITRDLIPAARALWSCEPYLISHKSHLPFSLQIETPETFGADRLAALAGVDLAQRPVLILDLGTFLTIDALTQNRVALGGIIFPGLQSCAEIYSKNSSSLANPVLRDPGLIFGKNTASAIQSGLMNGYTFLVRGFLKRMAEDIKKECELVATGGGWPQLKHNFPDVQYVPDLTHIGIRKIYQMNKSKA